MLTDRQLLATTFAAIASVALFIGAITSIAPDNYRTVKARVVEDTVFSVGIIDPKEGHRAFGTAFWISKTQLLTNCHVADGFTKYLRDGKQPVVTSHDGDQQVNVRSLYCDRPIDLALLEVDEPYSKAKPVVISTKALPGEDIWSAGYGMGDPLSYKDGLLGYIVPSWESWGYPLRALTLPVIGGDSGSPIFNRNNQLVAVLNSGALAMTFQGQRIPLANRAYSVSLDGLKEFWSYYRMERTEYLTPEAEGVRDWYQLGRAFFAGIGWMDDAWMSRSNDDLVRDGLHGEIHIISKESYDARDH